MRASWPTSIRAWSSFEHTTALTKIVGLAPVESDVCEPWIAPRRPQRAGPRANVVETRIHISSGRQSSRRWDNEKTHTSRHQVKNRSISRHINKPPATFITARRARFSTLNTLERGPQRPLHDDISPNRLFGEKNLPNCVSV